MPGLSTTYLLPAVLLNPAFVLHLINTFASYWMPAPSPIVHSHQSFMESLGPVPGTSLYFNMHTDNKLCWHFTAIMVVAQILAFGKISENRNAKKRAKAATLEREKGRKDKLDKMVEERKPLELKANGHVAGLDGACDSTNDLAIVYTNGTANGVARDETVMTSVTGSESTTGSDLEESLIETSEEEMMI